MFVQFCTYVMLAGRGGGWVLDSINSSSSSAITDSYMALILRIFPGREQKPGGKQCLFFVATRRARACVCVWVISESTGEAARGLGRLRIESWAGQRQQQRQGFGRWRWGSGAAPSCRLQDASAEWNVVAVKLSRVNSLFLKCYWKIQSIFYMPLEITPFLLCNRL